jgi:hypothetical protein
MNLVIEEGVQQLAGERHQRHPHRRAHRGGKVDGYCVADGKRCRSADQCAQPGKLCAACAKGRVRTPPRSASCSMSGDGAARLQRAASVRTGRRQSVVARQLPLKSLYLNVTNCMTQAPEEVNDAVAL